jgi:hypothetical protein
MASKPKVPAPPLIEWAARNTEIDDLASCCPDSRPAGQPPSRRGLRGSPRRRWRGSVAGPCSWQWWSEAKRGAVRISPALSARWRPAVRD